MSVNPRAALDRRLNIKPEYRQSYSEKLLHAQTSGAHRDAVCNPRSSIDRKVNDLTLHPGSNRFNVRNRQIQEQNEKQAARLKDIATSPTRVDHIRSSCAVFNPGKEADRLEKARRLSRQNVAIARRLIQAKSTPLYNPKDIVEHERFLKLMSRVNIPPKRQDRIASCDYSELERLAGHPM